MSITLSVIGLSMMFEYEENKEIISINDEETPDLNVEKEAKIEDIKPNLTLIQALKTPEVYMLTLMSSFYFIGPTNFDIYYKVKL